MRGAIIGFGKIARGHLSAYKNVKDIDIVAIVEPVQTIREHIKSINPKLKVYKKIHELFSKTKCDFIDICTPPNTHLEYISLGLKNNCHVICEKPLLLRTIDFQEITLLQKLSNKIIYPCHNYKFAPILGKIKSTINNKGFGEIICGHFRTLRSGHAVGIQEWNANWRKESKVAGGGILWDHGPHNIYLTQWLSNKIPESVSCILGNLNSNLYSDNEDTALLTIYYPDNIYFIIDLSWAASYRKSYYEIVGSKQVIIVDDNNLIHTQSSGNTIFKNINSEFNDTSHKTWFEGMFKDFINITTSLKESSQKYLLNEAFIVSLIIEHAYISARKGGTRIQLPKWPEYMMT
jgi:predicted dehydrogenase